MRRSRMLEKLRRGEYVTMAQSWVIPHWKIVDIMGFVGFDGVWIEHEHSDFSYGELSQMILAARAHDMDSVVRVERTGYNDIIKPLEAGATGLVLPHCMSGEDARSIVREAKFSPLGMRGSGGSTDSDYGMMERMEYFRHANSETFVAGIIEDKEAVEDVDAIAATEGIDMLLMGPGDLYRKLRHHWADQTRVDRARDRQGRRGLRQAWEVVGNAGGQPGGRREGAQARRPHHPNGQRTIAHRRGSSTGQTGVRGAGGLELLAKG